VTLSADQAVRDIAIENPATVPIFESLGIDYCCGGDRPLREACGRANVAVDRALELLEGAQKPVAAEEAVRWKDAKLRDLAAHIVEQHHAYVRREAPRLEALGTKVVEKHGERHPELSSIRDLFLALAQELSAHMIKEENLLFPYISKMESSAFAREPLSPAFFGSVQNPIARMLAEHEDSGVLLAQIRKLSEDYHAPQDACPSYRALYSGLEEFERDLHRHIHLENNLLFPRAVELERRLLERT
jgi:regulator of cell morphogenesis and NO signaling